MNRYEWLPSESAPKNYPMKILDGVLSSKDGKSVYIPEGKTICKGWGNYVSTHLVGDDLKPVPSRLAIRWFSFAEDKFYQGDFDLPYEKLKGMFEKGHLSRFTRKKVGYNRIIVGVAPGGKVAVWLYGEGVSTEIDYLQADEIKGDWTEVISSNTPREEWIQKILKFELPPMELESLRENGVPFGLWDKYRIRYPWKPVMLGNGSATSITFAFFNGEVDFLDYESKNPLATEKFGIKEWPIPQKIHLKWMLPTNKVGSREVTFDEQEIFKAFTKLHTENPDQEIQLQFGVDARTRHVNVFLRNDEYIIELKKAQTR